VERKKSIGPRAWGKGHRAVSMAHGAESRGQKSEVRDQISEFVTSASAAALMKVD